MLVIYVYYSLLSIVLGDLSKEGSFVYSIACLVSNIKKRKKKLILDMFALAQISVSAIFKICGFKGAK